MSVTSTASFVDALRQHGLLEPGQLQELDRQRNKFAEPRALAKHLLQQGWLTPYQVNHVLHGRGADLVLGPYLLLDRLGEGGNGQVFRARHRTMNRPVALKILRQELTADAEIVGRFHREIEVVSQISHPNIVHAYDAGPIGATLVLAMEFVDGSDLHRQVQAQGRLAVAAAAEYIRQAALGLQHAHERGLIHRDIKPANLLVGKVSRSRPIAASDQSTSSGRSTLRVDQSAQGSEYGVVKILDLGLARLRHSVAKSATSSLTLDYGPEVIQGTLDYMAPEQALDFHAADIRADIYSLGCTFFFLLTGEPPFPGGSLAQKLMKHQQVAPPAIQKLRPDVPAALATVLEKMLAKRPEDRFQTPGEVADALTALFVNGTIATGAHSLPPAKTVRPAPATRWPARAGTATLRSLWRIARGRPRLTLVVAGVLLAGLAVVLWPFPGPKPLAGLFESSDQTALKDVLELLERLDGSEQEVLRRLTRLIRKYPGMLTPLRDELQAVGMRRPGSPQAMQAAVWLTYLPSPLDQLDPRQIPEKKRFAGQPAELVAVLGDQGPNYYRVTALAFRPDARMLALGTGPANIVLWDLGQAAPQRLPSLKGHASNVVSLAFTPDGKWLASGSGNNSSAGDNSIRLWDLTQPEIKAEAVLAGHTNTVNALTFAPDGKWLASGGQDQSVRLWELATREGRVLAPKTAFVNSLAFAPNGLTLAVAGSYSTQIRLLDLAPPLADKYVDLKYAASEHTLKVAYAPDGKTLASHIGNQIVLWDPGKQVELARLKGHAAGVYDLVYLPDGQGLISAEAATESQTNVNEPEGQVIRWSLASREPAATWRFPCGGVKRLALASDGRHLAVGGRNSIVYILRLGPPKIAP